ncbi:MAG: alcohol dehydrogenase catalytic domain-containing protein [Planctomycetota bacterium]|nr:alcohol dehydrogenase catalytic domain-containing protein [Planctomycetota bacterium]MDA1138081.1 alcohol dehydrogenase catalytic domain-containing protein [Planctomycetota bacterium]
MKAAIVTEPGNLIVQDIPAPTPGEYEVLCRNLFGATCTATDLHLIHNTFPFGTNYPTILGHESVGEVIEVGPKVRNFKLGDRITRAETRKPTDSNLDIHWGGFVEFSIARDHQAMKQDGLPEKNWAPFTVQQVVPQDIDPAAATMFITWRETLSYSHRMGIKEANAALVVGSGGTALSFVVHARNVGVKNICSVGNAGREELFRKAGATEFVDYKAANLRETLVSIRAEGFDFVVDSIGKNGVANQLLPHIARGGAIGIYGIDDYHSVSINPMAARGTFTIYKGGYDQAEVHDSVIELVRQEKLDAALWMDLGNPFPLDEIRAAYDAVASRKMVKALVQLSEG